MPGSSTLPLYLFQVLEEEFISLHSTTPLKIEVVSLPPSKESETPRNVIADLNFWFDVSHIKSVDAFISELLLDPSLKTSGAFISAISSVPGQDWTRVSLIRELRNAFDQAALAKLRDFNAATPTVSLRRERDFRDAKAQTTEAISGPPPARPPTKEEICAEITKALNIVLTSRELYQPDRFSPHWFTPTTRRIVSSDPDPGALSEEDLIHFNRLLLEDSFPETFERIHEIRLAAMYQRLHANQQSAICLSGGGIRSGTFALGLLQGLARHNLLKQFKYLSTVSGGGYIGSWLTAWIHRHPEGLAGVTRSLANKTPESKVDPDAPPIRFLRTYSNFITPQVGLLSADTWTFIGIYIRNLFLNWTVFIPLLFAVLVIPRINVATILSFPPNNVRLDWALSTFNVDMNVLGRYGLLVLGWLLGSWALAYVTFNRPSVREELRRRRSFWRVRSDQRSFLIFCLLPLLSAAFCLTTYWAWSSEASRTKSMLTLSPALGSFVMGVFGLVLTLTAWLISTAILDRFGLTKLLGRFRLAKLKEIELSKIENSKIDLSELGVLIFAGFVGGCLLSLGSLVSAFGQPATRLTAATAIAFPHWLSWNEDSYLNVLAWRAELYACFAVPVFLTIFLLAATIFVGVSSRSPKVEDEDREWWARFGGWVLIAMGAWIAANALVIFGPIALLSAPKTLVSIGGISGLVSILVARSAKTPANEAPSEMTTTTGLIGSLVTKSLPLLGMIFLAAFLSSLSLATTGIFQGLALLNDSWPRMNLVSILALVMRISPVGLAFFAGTSLPTGPIQPVSQAVNGFSSLSPFVPAACRKIAIWFATAGQFTPAGPVFFAFNSTFPRGPAQLVIQACSWLTPLSPMAAAVGREIASTATLAQRNTTWLTAVDFPMYLSYIYPAVSVPSVFTGAKIVHMNVLHHTSFWFVLGFGAMFFVVGMALSHVINLNLFSLHAGYRSRLIRGFLGASRPDQERRPNPFTGFDPLDNLAMHESRPALFGETDFIEPLKLIKLLRDTANPVSGYLARNGLLKNLDALSRVNTASARVIAALRRDLNAVLETQDLERFAKDSITLNGLANASSARSTEHIILNRIVLQQNYPEMFRNIANLEPYRLMPVINATLNLVGGENLAWQQRKAEPFTMSPLHAGCFRVGYRDAREYGGNDTGGISLGTAAAISGAAASSNMGYYTTSPVISLLLTFFNVRLGWWLGNPGPAGDSTFRLRAPKYSVGPVLDEAFGFTDDTNKYVYLSDGGHFENLAIYEMVLRRCHIIVASDGAQDKEYRFTDLGNAIRKIRIDLGVPIDFWTIPICSGWPEQENGMYWAVGRIRYSCIDGDDVEDGLLLYIKPAVYGNEPRDVLEYKKSFPDFPHQTTADQFFDEPQFESYRILGSHIIEQMCGTKYQERSMIDMIERAVSWVIDSPDTDPRLEKWARGWVQRERAKLAPKDLTKDATKKTPASSKDRKNPSHNSNETSK